MHQSTTPSLLQTIWPRLAPRQVLSLPTVQTLLPVTFGYPLSSQAVVMRQLRACDEGHWHAHTKGLPWGLPEVVGTVQVHFSRSRLLQRGLEFHACTINKSAHTKKVCKTIVCTSYVQTAMVFFFKYCCWNHPQNSHIVIKDCFPLSGRFHVIQSLTLATKEKKMIF